MRRIKQNMKKSDVCVKDVSKEIRNQMCFG